MRIDVFTDLICPWCWLGKRRLDVALGQRPGLGAEVHYWPFELAPQMPAGGLPREEYLAAKLGGPQALREAQARLAELGAGEGLAFRFDLAKLSPNTRAAHALSRIAAEHGRQAQVQERLFAAFFAEGRDIGEPGTLAAIAAAAGLDGEAVRSRLTSRSDWPAIEALEREGAALGIRGVPFFVFERRMALSGAQPAATLLEVIDRLAPAAAAS
jgi:predicted DsbA family dithiol-disulfide isomerase